MQSQKLSATLARTVDQADVTAAADGAVSHVQDITILPAINGLETEGDAEDVLSWEQNERLLNQADEDEEVDAEADATEADPAAWTSIMPTRISLPEDLEPLEDAAPASSINWSFQVTALALSHRPRMHEHQIAQLVLSLVCVLKPLGTCGRLQASREREVL